MIPVSQFPSGDSFSGQILNMFDKESQLTIMESRPTLTYPQVSADSSADAAKVGMWVWAFSVQPIRLGLPIVETTSSYENSLGLPYSLDYNFN